MEMTRTRFSMVLLCFIMMTALVPLIAMAQSDPDIGVTRAASVRIELDLSGKATVTPERDGTISLFGNVNVTTVPMEPMEPIHVTLEASSNEWEVSVSPRTMTFDSSGSRSFSATVQLGSQTMAGETSWVDVQGTWRYASSEVEQPANGDRVSLTVGKLVDIEIQKEASMSDHDLSASIPLSIPIHNMGNDAVSIILDVEQADDLIKAGLELKLPDEQISIEPYATGTPIVELKLPDEPPREDLSFGIQASVAGGGDTDEIYFHLMFDSAQAHLIWSHGEALLLIRDIETRVLGLESRDVIETGGTAVFQLELLCFFSPAEDVSFTLGSFGDKNISYTFTPSSIPSMNPGGTTNIFLEIQTTDHDGWDLMGRDEIGEDHGGREHSLSGQMTALATDVGTAEDIESIPHSFLVVVQDKVKEESGGLVSLTWSQAMATASAATLLTVAAFGIGTEVGKYRFLAIFFVPLYTKLHHDRILDHFSRGRVYQHIKNNPGIHYSQLKRDLELNNGGLAYHLRILEREELVRSCRMGHLKLFYPTGVKIPEDLGLRLHSLQVDIRAIVGKDPGISQTDVASRFPTKSRRAISRHIKILQRQGLLRLVRDGKDTRCYLAEPRKEGDVHMDHPEGDTPSEVHTRI